MGKKVVLVPNILKEMDSVFALKESSGHAVYHCVSPALDKPILMKMEKKELAEPAS